MEQIFRLMLESFNRYFRIDVHGIEHIPKRGKALIAPNHSGCSGLDAVMLTYLLQQKLPRIPRVLTLWTFFKAFPFFAPVAQRMGLTHIAISVGSVEGVNQLIKNLEEAGIVIVDGPRRTGDGYYESVILDPDGNRVEVTS